jgi:hypothetical protein
MFKNFIFQNFQESYVIKQLLHLNLINKKLKKQQQWNVIKQLRHFTACEVVIAFKCSIKHDIAGSEVP